MLPENQHKIDCHLGRLLADRDMTLAELAERIGLTVANLSVLKNDRAKAIRFNTLSAVCRELHCQPGDVLTFGVQ
ncbi:helix-turn-helix transcriptional regulator [Streptomyces lunalinharesii]|uniref:Helix-turn-helix transcriptional regulator n=1 Tax=Streptomyces lunalinharesii TaxID=333384 RepID=A0ABN3SLT9_9ACTN